LRCHNWKDSRFDLATTEERRCIPGVEGEEMA
jgi:hypothetical protein